MMLITSIIVKRVVAFTANKQLLIRIFSMKTKALLILSLLFFAGCSAVESTGEAVGSAGEGVGDAVSGVSEAVGDAGSAVGRGAGKVISGTGRAVESGARRTGQRGY